VSAISNRLWLATLVLLFIAALATGNLAPTPSALAQSFDCDKAKGQIEDAICSDVTLGELDTATEQVIEELLVAERSQHDQILAEERAWIAKRDQECRMTRMGETPTCLITPYQQRLSDLKARRDRDPIAKETERHRVGLCQSLIPKYRLARSQIAAHPPRQPIESDQVLDSLTASSDTGVTLSSLGKGGLDPTKFNEWAKAQQPPIKIDRDLLDQIANGGASVVDVDQLPETDLYAVNGTAGTASCYQLGTYFEVKNGQARAAPLPLVWNHGACGVAQRSFGEVDGVPVALQEEPPGHSEDRKFDKDVIYLAPWDSGHFGPSCSATFQFQQKISFLAPSDTDDPGSNSSRERGPDVCEGDDCEALHNAALDLVRDIQTNSSPIQAWRDNQIALLTSAQGAEFAAMDALAEPSKGTSAASPMIKSAEDAYMDGTMGNPLILPLVVGGRVYLARAGHIYTPDVPDPDWEVEFDLPGDPQNENELTVAADFEIVVENGALKEVSIQ
jgi:uncharacterized protein